MHLRSIMSHKISRILTLTCTADVFINVFLGIFIILQTGGNLLSVGSIFIAVLVSAQFIATFFIIKWVNEKIYWYETILDSIPFPISVTDSNMKWTFINRPVENMFNTKRAQIAGQHCSNWKANICKTENCGIECLRRNKYVTRFNQWDKEFRVDVNYISNRDNKKIGHVEVVQDITELIQTQRMQSNMIANIRDTSDAIISVSAGVTDKAKENAKMATEAASLIGIIKDDAEKGFEQMNRMTQAVEDINEASHSINNVIKTINSIALQTNILALNASVEAVRAGEHGRSFATVAEEVKSLALLCAKSANDTVDLISNCIQKAELGAQIVSETAASLTGMISGINKSDVLIKEIADSSMEQSAEVAGIYGNIEKLDHILSTTAS